MSLFTEETQTMEPENAQPENAQPEDEQSQYEQPEDRQPEDIDAEVLEPYGGETTESLSLAQHAVNLLHQAAAVDPDDPAFSVEERNVWQPDSWLLQRCWQSLADYGAGEQAMSVAALLERRNPLAPAQALYRVAKRAVEDSSLAELVTAELERNRVKLFSDRVVSDEVRQTERLLLAAASAACIGDHALAFACLERMDQMKRVWERVFASAELRNLLAETVATVGLQPLVSHLITGSIRRFEEFGAQFLHQILSQIGPRTAIADLPRRLARLLQRCVETYQYATLNSLYSRRLASIAFGQMGNTDAVLEQLTTIANVQEARRASGLHEPKSDPFFLRQVKRPTANPDIDFQVYTLQETIKTAPVRQLSREQRIALADRIASLAIQSDGWTAAGATVTLIELGALKYAVDIVDHIPPEDPTRSEGVVSLVRGLLDFGEPKLADEQVRKALGWIKALGRQMPERATVWGLAQVYLDHERPDIALHLLEQRYDPPGLWERVRNWFHRTLNDDELRHYRLRMEALAQQEGRWSRDLQTLYEQLRQWAPRLLDGEALVNFYVDGMIRPLLDVGKLDLVWTLLPQVQVALANSSGDKHAVQVSRTATLLAERAVPRAMLGGAPQSDVNGDAVEHAEVEDLNGTEDAGTAIPNTRRNAARVRTLLRQFLIDLWQMDAKKGIWQIVHGIEGSLPLILAMEGPDALVTIAQSAANEGGMWAQ